MTYCLAWRTADDVFLVADTALTRENGAPPETASSSFGELHVVEAARSVQERVLKIAEFNGVAACFAGCVSTAMAILATVRDALGDGLNPSCALRNAVYSHTPFERGREARIVLAYYDGEPHLLAFNDDGGMRISDDRCVVQMGSIPDHFRALSLNALRGVVQFGGHGEELLVALTCIVQSYCVSHTPLSHGVGGAVCGVRIGATGIQWHPDTLYALISPDQRPMELVASLVREGGLITYSTLSCDERVFSNELSVPDATKWQSRNGSVGPLASAGRFAYICLINLRLWNVTIIKMDGRLQHPWVRVEPALVGGERGLRLHLRPEVVQRMDIHPTQDLPLVWTSVPSDPDGVGCSVEHGQDADQRH